MCCGSLWPFWSRWYSCGSTICSFSPRRGHAATSPAACTLPSRYHQAAAARAVREAGSSADDAGSALRVPVQLTVRLLGTEVLHISTEPDKDSDDEGTHSSGGSFELGFAAPHPMDGEASDTARWWS
jgi:hypothetical protein